MSTIPEIYHTKKKEYMNTQQLFIIPSFVGGKALGKRIKKPKIQTDSRAKVLGYFLGVGGRDMILANHQLSLLFKRRNLGFFLVGCEGPHGQGGKCTINGREFTFG